MQYLTLLVFVLAVAAFEPTQLKYLTRTRENLERAYKISNYLNNVDITKVEEVEVPLYTVERDVVIHKTKRSVIGPDNGDVIIIGTTTALTGDEIPYSTEQFSYITFAVNYINNVVGGVEVNGTIYKVKLVWYDDASNCELISILSERLIVVDQADVLLTGTTIGCNGSSIMAEQYQVPCINGGNYNYFFDFPDGLNWTVVPILNPEFISAPCIKQFCQSGAKSAVIAGTSTIYPAFNFSLLVGVATYCQNFSLYFFDELDYDSVLSTDYLKYLQPYITKWKNVNADLFMGGVGPTQVAENLFNAMRYNKYNPKGYYGWDDVADQQTRQLLDWQGYGATASSNFDVSFNFTDPIFGNTSIFNAAYFATFNDTANAYAAGNIIAVILAITAIKNAGSFDKLAIRNELFNFNQSTLQGVISFNNITGYTLLQNYCFQYKGKNNYVVVGNPSFDSYNLTFPWNFDYIAGYKFAPIPKSWWQKNKNILLPCVTIIPFFIIIAIIVIIYFAKRWHVIFIPDRGTKAESDW